MGFVVQRSYEAVDDPEDVVQDEDGVWHIKAGARVRVRLTMVADNRRYHVALVDPLPAGLEIVNPALAVSGDLPQDPNAPDYRYGWWWWGTWYEHQNMRDERAEAFTSLLWEGVYNYSYVARATTPGTFVVPPAKAEEMYSPEVFGRSSSDWVIVEVGSRHIRKCTPKTEFSSEVHKRSFAVPFCTVLDLEAWGEKRSGEAAT